MSWLGAVGAIGTVLEIGQKLFAPAAGRPAPGPVGPSAFDRQIDRLSPPGGTPWTAWVEGLAPLLGTTVRVERADGSVQKGRLEAVAWENGEPGLRVAGGFIPAREVAAVGRSEAGA